MSSLFNSLRVVTQLRRRTCRLPEGPRRAGSGGRPAQAAPAAHGAKSDALNAIRAAREALAQDNVLAPRRRGDREALRVLLTTRQGACMAKVCGVYARGEAPIQGARNDRDALPQLNQFPRDLDMALEQLVAEALAPYHPSQRVTQLALTVLDYGVWRWLRQRGPDEAAELVALLEFVVQPSAHDRRRGAPNASQARTSAGAERARPLRRGSTPRPNRLTAHGSSLVRPTPYGSS
jgi:hypothetical protein